MKKLTLIALVATLASVVAVCSGCGEATPEEKRDAAIDNAASQAKDAGNKLEKAASDLTK